MQTLVSDNINTLRNAHTSSVLCGLQLNREETLSVASKKTSTNNPEVDLRQHRAGSDLRVLNIVYVLNQRGQPLMPTNQAHTRNLLRKGEAKVIKIFPYTVQLTKATGENKQKYSLGVDAGSKIVGFSAITEKKEQIAGDLNLDQKTSERLIERRCARRNRRNHLRYRQPRFNNRVKSVGWLPPSVQRKFDTHITLIEAVKKLLPISKVTVEVGNFDIAKLINPNISGKEYQQGSLFGFDDNLMAFLMAREHGKCQICGKGSCKGDRFEAHHVIQRSAGGSDRPENRALLHKSCHYKLHHKKNFVNKLRKAKQYKDASFMAIVGKKFQEVMDCETIYGYETQAKRNQLGLEKSHINDAFVIAGGTDQKRCKPIEIKQVHRNNRVLQLNRKGFKPSIKRVKSKVNPGDLFWVAGKRYSCAAMYGYGRYICYGSTKKKEYFPFKKVEKVFHFGSFVWN